MLELASVLSPKAINLDNLLLDPNNPRFSELGEEINLIPELRFNDDKVQSNTFAKMKDPVFGVSELRDTIKTLGFLPMDRIVVRKWKGMPEKYVVIEGNRRVTALKWLIALNDTGKETFNEQQLGNFTNLECLLLNDDVAPEMAHLILPGLRHISGIKEWGPYQKAKVIVALRNSGMSPQETAQSLGLHTRTANQAYRCFKALDQMQNDEEYGEFATPKMYSYFEEILKKPTIKQWLGWNDNTEKFENNDQLLEFYSWIVPSENSESLKLPEALSVRDLGKIIQDDSAMKVFRSPDGTLLHALVKFHAEHPEEWIPKISAANSALKSLTPDKLRKMDEVSHKAIEDLQETIAQVLKDREALLNIK
jgi:hypothetical protein